MPLLVLLFLVSYGILTALVFEQGQTIEAQRILIREMLKDSTQLAALKDKMARDEGQRTENKTPAQPDRKNLEPGNSAPGAKGSDAKAVDKAKRPGKSAHTKKEVPDKPAVDRDDVRYATSVI